MTPVIRTEEDRSARSPSTIASASRSACSCCRARTSSVVVGRDVGVAVAVAADPAAEAQRARVDGQRRCRPARAARRAPRACRAPRRGAARRGSRPRCAPRRRLGARDAQLVGLPQQVDVLLQAALGAACAGSSTARSRSSSSAATRRILVSTVRRAASVGWAVKTGRTARWRSRRRPRRRLPGGHDPVDRLREPGAVLGRAWPQLAARGGPARRRWPGGSRS